MDEHSRDTVDENQYSAVYKQNALPGHTMDLRNPNPVFNSDCRSTRTTVEAALIQKATTVLNNTAPASINSNHLVVPLICRSTRFNLKKLSEIMPQLTKDAIPRYKRTLFGGEISRPPPSMRSQPPLTPVSRRTRSQTSTAPQVHL